MTYEKEELVSFFRDNYTKMAEYEFYHLLDNAVFELKIPEGIVIDIFTFEIYPDKKIKFNCIYFLNKKIIAEDLTMLILSATEYIYPQFSKRFDVIEYNIIFVGNDIDIDLCKFISISTANIYVYNLAVSLEGCVFDCISDSLLSSITKICSKYYSNAEDIVLRLFPNIDKTHKIYTLSHPETNHVFYVGRTCKDLKERLSGHIGETKAGKVSDKCSMISKMLSEGVSPIIELVEEFEYEQESETAKAELYWMCQFRSWGFNIHNIAGMN